MSRVPGAVGFEHCYGVERVVEHQQQDGGDCHQKLFGRALLFGDFGVANIVQNQSANGKSEEDIP